MSPTKTTLKYAQISKPTFDNILSRYASIVPSALRELDELRYDTMPATVQLREEKGAYLTKDEVVKLVEWKLKHGRFRPKLLSLVSSNSPSDIEKTTREAFSPNVPTPLALNDLTKLRGIGPATASLLLSVHDPTHNPFFSDELFRWMLWDTRGSPKGWQRTISYTAKQYEMLLTCVDRLRERLGVSAVDMEKVAWVLGKARVDVGLEEGLGKLEEWEKGGGVVGVGKKGGGEGMKRKRNPAEAEWRSAELKAHAEGV
ncbi:hypothetical protein BU23DRAFT_588267 [Bimuria novae-zelandiae CBS 107.79]|uniref:DNA glycosylase n=1 Tax=Bimuria novae-zelandiae CBS 107.79 TaxID=1447943 RepID=A0A6A5VG89_9PLEO|nr:hypothetical protein BU23DRAFT_588267 [Bimuria novae-zelandiae CBS 107.79]